MIGSFARTLVEPRFRTVTTPPSPDQTGGPDVPGHPSAWTQKITLARESGQAIIRSAIGQTIPVFAPAVIGPQCGGGGHSGKQTVEQVVS